MPLRLPELFDGPPPRLPDLVDRAAERWWQLAPRARFAAAGAAITIAALVGMIAAASPTPTVDVLVATRDLPVGTEVSPADLRLVTRPAAEVPDSAVSSLPDVAVTAAVVPAGAVLTDLHLADGGLAATLDPGRVAVAVPADRLPPSLRAGQHVDLLASGADGRAEVLARGARVLARDEGFVWVAVTRDEAPGVVAAAAWGAIGVGVLPPSG